VLFSPWEWAMHRYLYHRVPLRALLPVYLTHHRDHHHVFFPARRFVNHGAEDGSPQAHPSVCRRLAVRLTGRDIVLPDRWVYFISGAGVAGAAAWAATRSPGFCAGIVAGSMVIVRLFGAVHGTIHRPGRHPWVEAQPWFPYLVRHHFIHHVDTEANANFLVPLADWLFGTMRRSLVPEELSRAGITDVAGRCHEAPPGPPPHEFHALVTAIPIRS